MAGFCALLSHFAHELKTPLHSISSVASVLAAEIDGKLSDQQKRQVAIIQSSTELLQEFVQELLETGSLTTGAKALRVTTFDVRAELGVIIASLRHLAEQKGVALSEDLARLPQFLSSDVTLLRKVVSNLVSNAIKYSPKGGKVWLQGEKAANNSIVLYVADTGWGIPFAEQGQVFEDGYRVKSQVKHCSEEGSGFGLFLVRAAIERLGGSIELRSELNQGAIFVVTIPGSATAKSAKQ